MNLITALGAGLLLVQAPVTYDVSFENILHHEARITVTFPDLADRPLEVRMSRSSPGRYALHEFAKNVYDVEARDGRGRVLAITRPDPHGWRIESHDGAVTFSYTLYGARADGTYTGLDETHAHLNMPASFVWARGLRDRPIRITFHPPPEAAWRVATQLVRTDDPFTFTAPDRDYFLDSPTELSALDWREWQVTEGDRAYTIGLAVHHDGTDADLDRYAEMAKAVVREARAVFGEFPRFDYGTYTFIADYRPHVFGDGMEHRNSTILTSTASLEDAALRLLRTLSHEFIHAWNVERLRPATLVPFDFEAANMSRELWFAEGFTSYYDDLLIRRAGLMDDADYARGLSGGLNAVIQAPGRRFFSPVEMSMQAPFVDAATSIDPTNHANTFLSYYTWGAAVGLGLDLTLRSRYDDLTLDDLMRLAWRRHGRTERPYTVDDLEAVLAELTGDPTFARDFFDRYVRGREVPDYGELLAHAGFALRSSSPGEAVMGRVQLRYDARGAEVTAATLIGSPLYEAGVDRGDILVRIDGRRIEGPDDLRAVLSAHAPGDRVAIAYESRGGRRTGSMVLAENPSLEIVPYEEIGRELTPEMRRFREDWLGSHAGQ